ncbi:hypothetical protein [Chryseobacterium gambrini]|uniref:hypothetical protein n=1 Tax=Chryseobacterium gambrini TaxID=373672 RepID=UPI0022F3B94B|nr:hypothetical protein [Chryseobacterium gambrini]WBX99469.1 hypothetical protein PE065_09495 [Chryseobacterium gambrini]
MNKSTILIFLFSFNFLFTQYRPPGMQNMELINNLSDVFEDILPLVDDIGAINNATNLIKQKEGLISESLKWTNNNGYLIRVKVLRNRYSGAKVPMAPEFLGIGSIPSDIVALNSSKITISTAVDPNLIFDPDDIFYIWVTRKKRFLNIGEEKLVYGYIINPSSTTVTMDALNKLSNIDMLSNIRIAQREAILTGLIHSLKSNIKDKEKIFRTTQQIDTYRRNLEVLEKLNSSLKKNLEQIKQTDHTLNFLGIMKNILSIASLVNQVSIAINKPSLLDKKKIKSPEQLIMAVTNYKMNINKIVIEEQNKIIIIKNNIIQEKSALMDDLRNIGVSQFMMSNLP